MGSIGLEPLTVDVELATMPNGEGWLFRPVAHGWCSYREIIDGTLGLEDVATMNDGITVEQENRARIERAARR